MAESDVKTNLPAVHDMRSSTRRMIVRTEGRTEVRMIGTVAVAEPIQPHMGSDTQ